MFPDLGSVKSKLASSVPFGDKLFKTEDTALSTSPKYLINGLKSGFSGFLKSNIYRIRMFPPLVDAYNNVEFEKVFYLCKDATFPFMTINTDDFIVNNLTQKSAKNFDYDPATFTFYVDKDNKVFDFIVKWLGLIKSDSNQVGYRSDYIGEVNIEVLNNRGDIKMQAMLLNAFPTNIENIQLSYGNDEIMTVSMSVVFDDIVYVVNNVDENREYSAHMAKRKEPYNSFFLGNLGYPLEALQNKIGGIIGQENLYKLEKAFGIESPASAINPANVLARKSQKNFSLAKKAF